MRVAEIEGEWAGRGGSGERGTYRGREEERKREKE